MPERYKTQLLTISDRRITQEGVIVIKAQEHRSLEKNREIALERLATLIRSAVKPRKRRKPTRPSKSARAKRMDSKTKAGRAKSLRGRIRTD